MIDIKKIDNTSIFNEMLKNLSFKFPVAEISVKTNYSKGSISEILKGKRSPTDEFLKKFAESFDIEIPNAKILAGMDLDALRELYGHTSKLMTVKYATIVKEVYRKQIMENSPDF